MKRTKHLEGGDQDGRSAHRSNPEKLSGRSSGSGQETPDWETAALELLGECPELRPLFRALTNCDPKDVDMSEGFGKHDAEDTGKESPSRN